MSRNVDFLTQWTLRCASPAAGRPELPERIAATVPGTVHTDLIAAGLLADPYLDLNEIRQDWVGRQDWLYQTEFESPAPGQKVELVCEGLDTFARIELNGVEIATTANMNRLYRFDITAGLKPGRNQLAILFRSAWVVGEELARTIEPRPNNYPGPANLMRKMACNFGWDWGPTVVTAGIWKPIRIESWTEARLGTIRPEITLRGGDGHVRIHADIARFQDDATGLRLVARLAGVTAEIDLAGNDATLELDIAKPDLWWPTGLGAPALYELALELQDEAGAVLDRWSRRIGFRSVRLDTTADDIGSAFTIVVNDVPVFICGANWIPDDCFLPRVTPQRYRARIAQAKAANINLLRVWGGGIYETDDFYAACDEAGMLVWQDFLFACAAYPEEGELPAEIEAEVRDNVVRLMPHPSLVLWNGNNENIWGFFDWGWQEALEGRTWGLGYYLDLLPKIVAELDPTRPYWAGSPYSGSMEIHPNDPEHGCTHVWDVWNDVGYEVYRDYIPRFCSEFGWQAPPTWATLEQSIHDQPLTPTSPGVSHHQKATQGNFKLLRGLKGHLPEPTSTDDWHFVTQLNQARAIRFGVEHMRSHRGRCMGTIVWQLNDCWPVTSWAAIDGYARLKPLWYALRAAYDPHLLTIQPRDGGLSVIAVNDATLFWRGPITIRRLRFDGTELASHTHWRLCADRLDKGSIAIPAEVATPGNPREECLVATMHDRTAYWFFNEDIDLDLPEAKADIRVERTAKGWDVHVTAKAFLRDLCLMADRLAPDAVVDDMLVNLLPGETRLFRITSPTDIDPDAIGRTPVFRCVNQLVHAEG